jgi:hypothetical protein
MELHRKLENYLLFRQDEIDIVIVVTMLVIFTFSNRRT